MKKEQVKQIVVENKFTDDDINVLNEEIIEVLRYYQIQRDEVQSNDQSYVDQRIIFLIY